MKTDIKIIKIDEVSQDLLNVFLEPYKEDCKYLKKAQFQYLDSGCSDHKCSWLIKADFSIGESCYIADTGHFNSVEFNICYNQLFYVMIAYLLENQLLEVMKHWDLDIYKRRQLSDFLIVKFSSTFKKPINSSNFQGTLSINKCSSRSNLIILKTSCAFSDDNSGYSEGEVTIAILDNKLENNLDNFPQPAID
ncbi:FcoT family thioesterase [Anabaena cylindrica UHCC 0172]|uniref:FcoT family thioesterase n=1 Tax=Anabaena cylindrica TaxID=1165 RepID=UPI002B1EC593|nr:FcoT family thioesterase [Anabaena cylindrica]MEA5549548.1 FcoT family thioesterase [Anabaena cylindrica UHCC 0172]